jgi:two-component system, OmpR family, phosphate regulon response regulator PhoB
MKRKILLIEDEKKIAKAYQEYLEDNEYEVEIAYDGEEGLRQVQSFQPDLILLDIAMPKLDGIAVLRELKSMGATKGIPVIMLTNLDQQENMAETAKLGSTLYFVKANTSLSTLAKWIGDLLEENNG